MHARLPSWLNKRAYVMHVAWETIWVALMQDGYTDGTMRSWCWTGRRDCGFRSSVRAVVTKLSLDFWKSSIQATDVRQHVLDSMGKLLPLLKDRPRQNGNFYSV